MAHINTRVLPSHRSLLWTGECCPPIGRFSEQESVALPLVASLNRSVVLPLVASLNRRALPSHWSLLWTGECCPSIGRFSEQESVALPLVASPNTRVLPSYWSLLWTEVLPSHWALLWTRRCCPPIGRSHKHYTPLSYFPRTHNRYRTRNKIIATFSCEQEPRRKLSPLSPANLFS